MGMRNVCVCLTLSCVLIYNLQAASFEMSSFTSLNCTFEHYLYIFTALRMTTGSLRISVIFISITSNELNECDKTNWFKHAHKVSLLVI